MIDEGYDEGQAIPIATEQAKKWYDNVSEHERNQVMQMSDEDLRKRDENSQDSRPELLEKGEHVIPHENGWAVKTQDAKQVSNVYQKKNEAVKRAQEIAENKQTTVIIHKKRRINSRKNKQILALLPSKGQCLLAKLIEMLSVRFKISTNN